MLLADQGILPPVVVAPVGALAVVVITAHLVAMRAAPDVPLSRRRIRTASGVVMLVTAAVLVYAFAFVSQHQPARFALAWTAAIMLLVVVLTLAGLDALNNVRLARIQRRRFRRQAGTLHAQLAEAISEALAHPPNTPDDQHHPQRRGNQGET